MTDPQVSREERERQHFNRLVGQAAGTSLEMARDNILRYASPPRDSPHDLEFVFHLLGNLRGATVVELGCGDGLNTVILASLGASVIGVDVSEESLALTAARARANAVARQVRVVHAGAPQLPLKDGTADKVLCVAILHHVDIQATALEIHRILKPSGVAVFLEPMEGPLWLRLFKRMIPQSEGVSPDERPLTRGEVLAVNKAIGRGGRRREFGLIYRFIGRLGLRSRLQGISLRVDAWLLARVRITRLLASPVVWEALKGEPNGQDLRPESPPPMRATAAAAGTRLDGVKTNPGSA